MSRGSKAPAKSAIGREDIATLRTIGEVAEHLDLPQHVLRFWETRFKEIDPVKRAGGRRLYRPRDIALVEAIRHLLYSEGYTIKGVQRILEEQGVDAVIADVDGRRPGAAQQAPAAPEPIVEQPRPAPTQVALDLPEPEPLKPVVQSPPAPPPVDLVPPPPDPALQRIEPLDDFEATREAFAQPSFPPAPALRRPQVIDAPVVVTRRLDPEQAQLLREALGEIEECKRLLGLTKR
jgi:DNA-binding transcriptional MerR regulator